MSYYCSEDDTSDLWFGPFDSKEAVVIEGIKRFSNYLPYFYIGEATSPEIDYDSHVENMLLSISDDFYTDLPIVGYLEDGFPWEDWPDSKNMEDLIDSIKNTIEQWVVKNSPITWQEIDNIEKIMCDTCLL